MNFRPVAVGTRTRIATCFVLAALSFGVFAACDENKGGGNPTTTTASTSAATTASASASTTATEMATASATASTTAEPAPSASGSAVASATASTKPTGTATVATNTATASATTTASAAPSDTAGAAAACGGKDQPKCPLQGWMATVMQPAMASKDPAKLAAALRASAKLAPPGYGDWAKYANDGAAAVDASKSVDDGKPSCKSCHGAYQKRYRTEMRDRKI